MCMYRLLFVIIYLAILALAGCAHQEVFEELPPLEPSPPEMVQQTPMEVKKPIISETQANQIGPPVDVTPVPLLKTISDPSVSRAREDLAQRLGLSIDEISVISALRMEFSAQAFYCQTVKERISRDAPVEVIEGQVILLAAGGGKYEYHANDTEVIFCRQQNKIRP